MYTVEFVYSFTFDGHLGCFPVFSHSKYNCYDYSCGSLCIGTEVQEKNSFIYMILLYVTFKAQSRHTVLHLKSNA